MNEEYLKQMQQDLSEQGASVSMESLQKLQAVVHAENLYNEAIELIQNNNEEEGLAILYKLAALPYPKALYIIGDYYFRTRNYTYAIAFLTKADSFGVRKASELLARCFKEGKGVIANPERAQIILDKLNRENN